jgi:hypothetical protein
LYDAVATIRKLPIFTVQEDIKNALAKEGLVNVQFAQPQQGRDLTIAFTVQESKIDRHEYDAKKICKQTIETILDDANWRLMSDGISYRLGLLSGRLRSVEREEDLIELVKRQQKKETKNSEKSS